MRPHSVVVHVSEDLETVHLAAGPCGDSGKTRIISSAQVVVVEPDVESAVELASGVSFQLYKPVFGKQPYVGATVFELSPLEAVAMLGDDTVAALERAKLNA